MEEQVYKIMAMLMLIHNENMSILQCLLRKDVAKEITEKHQGQMQDILSGKIGEENGL